MILKSRTTLIKLTIEYVEYMVEHCHLNKKQIGIS